ncbi:MAG TPA: hypothetical protein PL009_01885 [Flavipsychrobacter sp.]|nr:hypothetical protein [Flavipsychrobacter sp.]
MLRGIIDHCRALYRVCNIHLPDIQQQCWVLIANFVMLRRLLSILFLSVYLIAATEMQQLLKLPLLIEHYTEHKQQSSHLSLWQFLRMHYANGNEKDADYDKDMKLPFKTHTETVHLLLFLSSVSHFSVAERIIYAIPQKFVIHADDVVHAAYAAAIWQPPRGC